jgi:hypothetical protein
VQINRMWQDRIGVFDFAESKLPHAVSLTVSQIQAHCISTVPAPQLHVNRDPQLHGELFGWDMLRGTDKHKSLRALIAIDVAANQECLYGRRREILFHGRSAQSRCRSQSFQVGPVLATIIPVFRRSVVHVGCCRYDDDLEGLRHDNVEQTNARLANHG